MVCVTQGVASLALGYGLDGLSARPLCVVSRASGALRSLRRVLGAFAVRGFPRVGRIAFIAACVGGVIRACFPAWWALRLRFAACRVASCLCCSACRALAGVSCIGFPVACIVVP